jgi:hypothetical protein
MMERVEIPIPVRPLESAPKAPAWAAPKDNSRPEVLRAELINLNLCRGYVIELEAAVGICVSRSEKP